jgi:hypothetical protein
MPVFVKGYSRAGKQVSSYVRKKTLGKVNRARKVMDKLKAQNWAANENIAREATLHSRYNVADRYLTNARNARLTRRSIGFRARRSKGF